MLELAKEQLDVLERLVPDHPASPKGGRPPMSKRKALAGIFCILDNGAKWKDLPRRFGSKTAARRWFLRRVKEGVFNNILRQTGHMAGQKGGLRLYECFAGGTFSKAKGGGDGIGLAKTGKGVKIMGLAGAQGLPVAATTAPASRHEGRLIQELFGFMLTEDTPQRVIGDKAYDSDKLAEQMALKGVELIAPNRCNRARTQDGRRPLRRFRRRWKAGRTIAWLQHFRRLRVR